MLWFIRSNTVDSLNAAEVRVHFVARVFVAKHKCWVKITYESSIDFMQFWFNDDWSWCYRKVLNSQNIWNYWKIRTNIERTHVIPYPYQPEHDESSRTVQFYECCSSSEHAMILSNWIWIFVIGIKNVSDKTYPKLKEIQPNGSSFDMEELEMFFKCIQKLNFFSLTKLWNTESTIAIQWKFGNEAWIFHWIRFTESYSITSITNIERIDFEFQRAVYNIDIEYLAKHLVPLGYLPLMKALVVCPKWHNCQK